MIVRKRPYPKGYRDRLLWLAAVLDRGAARLRVHVQAHTPRRGKRTAAEIKDGIW